MPIDAGLRGYGIITALLLLPPAVRGGVPFMSAAYSGLSNEDFPISPFGCGDERLCTGIVGGGYPLLKGEGWSIGPVLRSRPQDHKSGDRPAFHGMENHGFALDAGIGFSWQMNWGTLSASYVTDILGRHKGFETESACTLWFPWKGFDVIPSTGVRCKSSGLTDYYHSLQGDEVLPGRPSYKAGSTIDPFVRIAITKGLSGRLSMLGAFQCEWFDDEIRDSPVVDQTYNVSLLLGLLYRF